MFKHLICKRKVKFFVVPAFPHSIINKLPFILPPGSHLVSAPGSSFLATAYNREIIWDKIAASWAATLGNRAITTPNWVTTTANKDKRTLWFTNSCQLLKTEKNY